LIPIVAITFASYSITAIMGQGVFFVIKILLSSAEVIYLTFIEVLHVCWAVTGMAAGFFLLMQFLKFICESILHLRPMELDTILFEWLDLPMPRRVPARPPPMFQFQSANPAYDDIYGRRQNPARMRSMSTPDLGDILFDPRIPIPTPSAPEFPTYNDIFGNSNPRSRQSPYGPLHHSDRDLSSLLDDDEGGGGDGFIWEY